MGIICSFRNTDKKWTCNSDYFLLGYAADNPEIYVDDIVPTSTAIALGELDYWYQGLPASIMMNSNLGANDIYNVLQNQTWPAGSYGEGLRKVINRMP